jgi:2-polyprenyl-6-methoxyphenol hydroxylase-like FAD-dependent oxidoreductase
MASPSTSHDDGRCDVLIVGAGPTGLALAAQLRSLEIRPLVVDAATDRVHESRALAVQPRTLEILRPFGVTAALLDRGNRAVRLRITAGRRVTHLPLFDIGTEDTEYPFLLFVSQAETEAALGAHLAEHDVDVLRRTTFESFREDGDELLCSLRRPDGGPRTVRARYLVGCDGAHSTVRRLAGISFRGGRYPQTFILADLRADGVELGAVNAYLGPDGPFFLFPLGRPAPWRLITLRPGAADGKGGDELTAEDLQALTDRATGGRVQVRDPVWTSTFRVHHRSADRYQSGRVFVAGDAAHVHSPAGAQGMNTGIQDADNLGWKLALVCRGLSPESLLDSYDTERRPVGEFVLRFTDRAFSVATSQHWLVRTARRSVAPLVLPLAARSRLGRRAAFRTVSQLGIRYRRSDLNSSADRSRRSPQPGDRLPDATVSIQGRRTRLHAILSPPGFHALLCGSPGWEDEAAARFARRWAPSAAIHHLVGTDLPVNPSTPDVVVDIDGQAFARLRVGHGAHLVVRPDGHIGYRADHHDLGGADEYLSRWLPGGRAT